MDDHNSKLYIDPFKLPSENDIKKKWAAWGETDSPCKSAAVKWLGCMGFVKESYQMHGRNENDGKEWHKFMVNKCFAPYTDYHECRIDEREASLKKMRADIGEDKYNEKMAQEKSLLEAKVGKETADKIWDYRQGYAERFKALRKSVDEERGIIRKGMEIPEYDKEASLNLQEAPKDLPKEAPPEPKSESKMRGWWSEPESRFRKNGDS